MVFNNALLLRISIVELVIIDYIKLKFVISISLNDSN